VELRDAYPKFEAAGIKLYAVSYDEPEALAAFSNSHDIPYPMLSDKGSKLIRQLGLLNTNITPDQVPFYGIPFPGTYLLDEQGVITDKLFHRNLAARYAAESMIDSALEQILLGEEEPSASGGDEEIKLSATFHGGGGTIKAAVMRELVVRFELADGLHIYDEPVPQGMVATHIEVSGPEGLCLGDVRKPPTRPLQLPGLDMELQVWDGQVDLVIPMSVDDRVASLVSGVADEGLEMDITVHYQACDDKVCRIPQKSTLHLSVPLAAYTVPSIVPLKGSKVSSMDSGKYMKRMVRRGLLRNPIGGLRFLRKTAAAIRRGPMSRKKR
jgi:peroxiredoxin